MAEASSAAAESFGRREWAETCRLLAEVPPAELDAADLDRLAVAAYLTGDDDAAVVAWEHAHHRHLDAGEPDGAALCSFWIAFSLMMRGHAARASAWLRRTEELVGEDRECPAAGYALIPALLGALDEGDGATALDQAAEIADIASRCSDRDLEALSKLGHGQALLALGDEAAGLALLDDAMLTVSSGSVGPIASGIVYCAVLLECMQLLDLARASEWTTALDSWCAAQPDLVPFRGQCLVHQSQLKQAAGDWPTAVSMVATACDRLADPPHPALGLACYQAGELHRLRGAFDAAAAAYGRASKAGHQPMPGLALLELARGDGPAAAAGIRRALGETRLLYQRPALLAAAVEIHLALGDLTSAKEASGELTELADRYSSEALAAMAEQATGSVLLAGGRGSEAMPHLRAASTAWRRLHMPYEAARASVLLGEGCLTLGDHGSGSLELDNAAETFAALGARPDLERVRRLTGDAGGDDDAAAGGLSRRELDVLAQVAKGLTNREVGEALSISPHTVRRHLENIFVKLGVGSRAAATAYAYEHDLL